jgi:putative NADH-flavin reductase
MLFAITINPDRRGYAVKILVIGSSGRTGLRIVERGISVGHRITAFTRKPDQLAGVRGIDRVIHGDGLNPSDIARAVEGQDAVICSVAPGHSGTTVADVTRNLIQAMRQENVRRLILISSNLLDATRPLGLVQLVKFLLRHALVDDRQAELLVKDSGLDWTIVRPGRLTDKPATGRIRLVYGGTIDSPPFSLTRADLATAIIDSVANPGDFGKTFEVTNGRALG